MVWECAAELSAGFFECDVLDLAAAFMMAIRHLGNGVDRVERFESVPEAVPPAVLGFASLPSPLPAVLADLAYAAGESVDGATGWCRSVTDDVLEVVIVSGCGVSQGGD